MVKKGASLKNLLDSKLTPEDLAWDHAMEISAAVYSRMKELNLKKKDLANKMGVNPSQVTKILKGEQSITLRTLAKLEVALDFDLSSGFSYQKKDLDRDYEHLVSEYGYRSQKRKGLSANKSGRVASASLSLGVE